MDLARRAATLMSLQFSLGLEGEGKSIVSPCVMTWRDAKRRERERERDGQPVLVTYPNRIHLSRDTCFDLNGALRLSETLARASTNSWSCTLPTFIVADGTTSHETRLLVFLCVPDGDARP